jgi:sulfonate transport system permease protein
VGLRLSLAVAWLVLIVSETINADAGIGFIINNARNFLQTNVVVVGLLTYALLGILTDFLVRLLERRALRWQGGVRR